MQEKLNEILKAIFWKKFTANQEKSIIETIEAEDVGNMEKATEICDLLDIERRVNRGEILRVLNGN